MIALSAIFFVGCNSKSEKDNGTETTAIVAIAEDALAEVLAGTFEGTLPCADCEGIHMVLNLDGENFTLSYEYMGEDDLVFREEGKFTLLGNRRTIEVASEGNETRYFNIYEDRAVMCDSNGVEPDGELAQHYVLIKK